MTGPVVTVPETENAGRVNVTPELTSTPEVKDRQPVPRSKLNFVLCIVLAINALFQFIAIFTPGWNTRIGDNNEVYESVYYRTGCVTVEEETECETRTFRKRFSDLYDVSTDARRPSLVLEYNLLVRYQMNIQISWIIVVGATIFQFLRYFRTKLFPKLTAINSLFLIISCSIMYQALYEAFAQIDFSRRSRGFLEHNVGFPYSVFFYAIAFVQTCACTFLIAKQTLDYIRYLQHTSTENQVKYDKLKNRYDADVEGILRSQYLVPDNTRLRANSRGSNNEDRHSSGDPPPRHSPRPSPRPSSRPSPRLPPSQSDNRTNTRYMELLERSHTGHIEPVTRSEDHSISVNDHSPRHSPRPSPSPSPRLSPRYTDNRTYSRYMELLEKARTGHDGHVASPQEHKSANEHSQTPRYHSAGPDDHSPGPRDHSSRPPQHFSYDTSQQHLNLKPENTTGENEKENDTTELGLDDINIQNQNTTIMRL